MVAARAAMAARLARQRRGEPRPTCKAVEERFDTPPVGPEPVVALDGDQNADRAAVSSAWNREAAEERGPITDRCPSARMTT